MREIQNGQFGQIKKKHYSIEELPRTEKPKSTNRIHHYVWNNSKGVEFRQILNFKNIFPKTASIQQEPSHHFSGFLNPDVLITYIITPFSGRKFGEITRIDSIVDLNIWIPISIV